MTEKNAISNIDKILSSAETDPAVGIQVARLTGDDTFSLFCAQIEPGRHVNAHYHASGIEIYLILEGSGNIYLGKPDCEGNVEWEETISLVKEDCFTVQAGTVHQLFNRSAKTLKAIFGCPTAHLGTDRTIVKGFE